jgi:hypothetical protein
MSTPADVMNAAIIARQKLCIEEVCGYPAGCGCLGILASVILAERERCATACASSRMLGIAMGEAAAEVIRNGEREFPPAIGVPLPPVTEDSKP